MATMKDEISDLIFELRSHRAAARTDRKIRSIDLAITECRNCIESLEIIDVLLVRAIGKNLSQWKADKFNYSDIRHEEIADAILSTFKVCNDRGHTWKVTCTDIAKAIGLSGTRNEAQEISEVLKKRIGVKMTRCGGRNLYPLKRIC